MGGSISCLVVVISCDATTQLSLTGGLFSLCKFCVAHGLTSCVIVGGPCRIPIGYGQMRPLGLVLKVLALCSSLVFLSTT